MLSEKVLFALNDVDDQMLDAVSRRMGYSRTRYDHTNVRVPHTRNARRIVLLAAVVAAFLALGVTAYALNIWGIREMYKTANRELPSEAEELIEPRTEVAEAEGWSCRITESLCDAGTVMLTVTVYGGEKYILVPPDAMLEDPLGVIGREGEGTLEEYAAQQGKELLFVGADLQVSEESEDIGIDHVSIRSENISDSEMTILIVADKTVSASSLEAVCQISAREVSDVNVDDIERVFLPITLTEGYSKLYGIFTPIDAEAVPGLRIGEATVTETSLGYLIEFTIEEVAEDALRQVLMTGCDELKDVNGSTVGMDEDGVIRARWTGIGTLDDTLTVHFTDWDKQPVGDIIFKKVN